MAKFFQLKVEDVRRETPDTVSIAFEIPDADKAAFQYKQGQYLTLKMDVEGEECRRSYSLSSSPDADNELRIAVKQVENGRVSTRINQHLKAGDVLEVMAPMGNFFTELNASQEKHYVALAAGSGITPVISILKSVLMVEANSRFTLFYGNRSSESIIFKGELDALQAKYGDRLTVCHILSREDTVDPLFSGRISGAKIGQLLDRYVDVSEAAEYFLCGPEEMIKEATRLLQNLRVDKSHIHFELFTTPVAEEGTKEEAAPVAGNGISQITVIMDDEETVFELATKGKNILDAALDQNVDVPFACKGAVCCTCKAKVTEGQVSMDMNYSLDDQEVADGFILTCQSHPLTPKVVVDFDQAV